MLARGSGTILITGQRGRAPWLIPQPRAGKFAVAALAVMGATFIPRESTSHTQREGHDMPLSDNPSRCKGRRSTERVGDRRRVLVSRA